MKRIVIDLTADSCDLAAAKLEEYQKNANKKLAEVCKRLAEVGIKEANAHLAEVSYGNEGNNNVYVDPTPVRTTRGYKIVMGGQDVYFVEYGTGDQVFPHGNPPSVPVGYGTYSETHAHQLVKYGFWWFEGEKLTGTHAQRPLYFAGRAIRESFHKIAEEVFKEI